MSGLLHLADVLAEEMQERGWSHLELAKRMDPEADAQQWGINAMALELFLEVRCPNIILGKMADQFALAFGLDRQFFEAIHEQWRRGTGECNNACCKEIERVQV